MKKTGLLSIILLVIGYNVFGDVTYISQDKHEGNWEDNSIWSKSETWANNNPGNNLGGSTEEVIIYGYVTRNGNLKIGGDVELIISDTLVITGNLIASGGSSIIVNDGGVLIVLGNLKTSGGLEFENTDNGIVAVGGDFSASGGAEIDTNNQFYLYDRTPSIKGGAEINGEDPRDNPENEFSNETDLQSKYPAIKDFIDSGGSTSLPIQLKSFTASVSNQSIHLNWVTAQEKNFSHFEVERSVDQNNWEQISTVQGVGESNTDVQYDFTDRNAALGQIYYRLKSVDIDGSYEYSPVVSVENGFQGALSIYPNPANRSSNLKIRVPASITDRIDYIAFYNLQGVKVKEIYNYNPQEEVQIGESMKNGLYLLKIQHNGLEENQKILINP